jgi:ABC-2 type transport system ATP-binding protein
VTLRFDGDAPADEFARLPAVTDLRVAGPRLSFLLSGEPNDVLRAAARHRVLDAEIARPSLEDAFVAYYGQLGARS